MKASYTVEMALLFPLILGVIIFSMGLSFYVYNLSIMDIKANELAITGEVWAGASDAYIEKSVKGLGQKILGSNLIAVKNPSVEVKVRNGTIHVTCNAAYVFPMVNIFFGRNAGGVNLSVEGEAELQEAVDRIRDLRKVEKAGEVLKGVK